MIFWAKTTTDGKPGISVYEHMVNVGFVARRLSQNCASLLESNGICSDDVAFLSALHDIGKISPGFQRKCVAWTSQNGLEQIEQYNRWDAEMERDHSKVSQIAIFRFLRTCGVGSKLSSQIAAVLAAHHGRIPLRPSERDIVPQQRINEEKSGIQWEQCRTDTANDVLEALPCNPQEWSLTQESPALWWLAGLTTVADWIGSDERFFSADQSVSNEERKNAAWQAVEDIGFNVPCVKTGLTFAQLFDLPGAQPNSMQQKAVSAINGPGVYVIEAPMGTGKTEAALWVTYELMKAGKASGFYFALPTQATSNRIHLRVSDFVKRIAPEAVSSRLIHGNSWLMEEAIKFSPGRSDTEDARTALDWFASAKRALLAPFGVGTVDQALLGVVAAKHFFVRRFALAGKVVIIDEVHSYDLYTGTLIDKIVRMLDELGATVIILSATLSGDRREKLIPGVTPEETEPVQQPYPLILGRDRDGHEVLDAAEPPPDRDVEIEFLGSCDAIKEASDLAERGGVVLWIANTVGGAQERYDELARLAGDRFTVGLLHSRFPFFRREELENDWMERLGKNGIGRCGSILVSTQVVEQSVDLDADLLITELAPTDMLLQRLGRIWRHERGERLLEHPRLCILNEEASLSDLRNMDASTIKQALGSKAYVYQPYVLLRSLEIWQNLEQISIPSKIRALIEATYEARDDLPTAWEDLLKETEEKSAKHRNLALRNTNIWSVQLEDREGTQTRLDERPTSVLVLCRKRFGNEVRFLDETHALFERQKFQLAAAQALHRNLVRIPRWCFERTTNVPIFSRYIHGAHALGIVEDDGVIRIEGLSSGIALRWSVETGVVIDKEKS